jgi:hypothetical protein
MTLEQARAICDEVFSSAAEHGTETTADQLKAILDEAHALEVVTE